MLELWGQKAALTHVPRQGHHISNAPKEECEWHGLCALCRHLDRALGKWWLMQWWYNMMTCWYSQAVKPLSAKSHEMQRCHWSWIALKIFEMSWRSSSQDQLGGRQRGPTFYRLSRWKFSTQPRCSSTRATNSDSSRCRKDPKGKGNVGQFTAKQGPASLRSTVSSVS